MSGHHRVFGLSAAVLIAGFALHACNDVSVGQLDRDDAGVADPVNDASFDVAPTCPENGGGVQLCASDGRCKRMDCGRLVDDPSVVCSTGFFPEGDRYGDPVCLTSCMRGPGQTFGDVLCASDDGIVRVCDAPGPGAAGTCLPSCELDAKEISRKCEGANQCAARYFGTRISNGVDVGAFALGVCVGACKMDADCKGTPGSKCQAESGLCVMPSSHVAYAKSMGDACDGTLAECNCTTAGGAGPNAGRGYCSHFCMTGTAGNALCAALVSGWTCSASLPATFEDGKPAFSAQPDGVVGRCEKSCAVDADCDALGATIGGGVTLSCETFADGRHCRLVP